MTHPSGPAPHFPLCTPHAWWMGGGTLTFTWTGRSPVGRMPVGSSPVADPVSAPSPLAMTRGPRRLQVGPRDATALRGPLLLPGLPLSQERPPPRSDRCERAKSYRAGSRRSSVPSTRPLVPLKASPRPGRPIPSPPAADTNHRLRRPPSSPRGPSCCKSQPRSPSPGNRLRLGDRRRWADSTDPPATHTRGNGHPDHPMACPGRPE